VFIILLIDGETCDQRFHKKMMTVAFYWWDSSVI